MPRVKRFTSALGATWTFRVLDQHCWWLATGAYTCACRFTLLLAATLL